MPKLKIMIGCLALYTIFYFNIKVVEKVVASEVIEETRDLGKEGGLYPWTILYEAIIKTN